MAYDDYSENRRQNADLVLSPNEYCFVQNKNGGGIRTYTGPATITISAQESLVIFNYKTKRFEEIQDFNKAKQLVVAIPENWYALIKNPTADGTYPETGKATATPELIVGHKIVVQGPASFSLFPGQMIKVIQGHRLRSNQYLLARVYDADAARQSANAKMIDAEGNEIDIQQEDYFVGQMLVIKGTEVSFYIPPTGVEVIPAGDNTYVRDAVTLERLEYAILKDEDGEKRYVHGPAVVFPQPTETFVTTADGDLTFRALELSPISGIYVKVIAEYDEDGIHHPIGEELFITGKDQMIYYPRPEHSIIQYNNKYMHYAIAIPEGEGRYILDRLTGEIKTILGPVMLLPDPRKEVVVKRKLTKKECELMYPGNEVVLKYNTGLTLEDTQPDTQPVVTFSDLTNIEQSFNYGNVTADVTNTTNFINGSSSSTAVKNSITAPASYSINTSVFDPGSKISRKESYTPPRTITFDNKFDGVVAVDVWTGYAINVVSKSGEREVVIGPATRLLDYDETLEAMELSSGKPKTTDHLVYTGFLRVNNNKVVDIINAQTADFINVEIKVSYCINFLPEYKEKWFSVENYVKYLCDHMRSLLKKEIRQYKVQDFYANSTDIVRNVVLNVDEEKGGRIFTENGMMIYDTEVLSVKLESWVTRMFDAHQEEIISKTLELSDAEARMEVVEKLAEVERKEAQLKNENKLYEAQMRHLVEQDRLAKEAECQETEDAILLAQEQAKLDLQETLGAIQEAELARRQEEQDNKIRYQQKLADIEKQKQAAYAQTIKTIVESIGPDLVAALSTKANADLLATATESMSPYAIANNESVADFVDRLMRGTTLEGILKDFSNQN